MTQIYKVFSNKRIFCLQEDFIEKRNLDYFDEAKSIEEFIELMKFSLLNKNDNKSNIVFISKKFKTDWIKIIESFHFIEAAGGLVKDGKNNFLFILKNNKWDLPKGKVDSGENHEQAAIREIKEETNLNEISVEKYLMSTYHLYIEKNIILKKTHWFLVKSINSNNISPQYEEGITDLKWFGKKDIPETYFSLKEVIAMIED